MGGNDSGILVMENSRAMISKTKINGAKIAGVAVQQKAVVDIRDCDISDCGYHGILAQTGKSIVTVVNCHVLRNQYGVSVCVDCLGTVTMEGDPPLFSMTNISSKLALAHDNTGNTIQHNKSGAIDNNSVPDKCKVTVDGTLFHPNGLTYRVEVAEPALGQAMRGTEAYKK